ARSTQCRHGPEMDFGRKSRPGRLGPVSAAVQRRNGRRRAMTKNCRLLALLAPLLSYPALLSAAPKSVSFQQSGQTVDAYDFVEVKVQVEQPDARNPFTDVELKGSFGKRGGERLSVDGFCESSDGSIFRVRFMPAAAGDYTYSITYRQGNFERVHNGTFRA